MNKRVLIIEGDKDLAQVTAEYLESQGFKTQMVHDGLEAIDVIIETQPDLVLLEIILPGCDGFEVCRKIHGKYNQSLVIFSSKDDSIEQILGLELGADDYISKSSEPRLILARLRAVLRRTENMPKQTADVLKFGPLVINSGNRSLTVDGNSIEITNPEYELLWFLAKNAGFVMSREAIFKSLRGIEYDGQNRKIDITISMLRSKLDSPKRIKTVRNSGYLFADA
ncbi:MAG: response regulator [Saccharospirillaceae bacterium]|nr:response regulator [Pseudomonadales bacterium]NRB77939.1 response regulator [Saccharospirillaceae bacterium]